MSRKCHRSQLSFDALEKRDCPSLFTLPDGVFNTISVNFDVASITFANGIVSATGTQSSDIIKVENYTQVLTQAAFVGDGTHLPFDNLMSVTITDASGNIRTDASGQQLRQYFASSSVNMIRAEGLGGNDRIINLTNKTTVQLGGDGNDTLTGGAGFDSLSGESGNDSLVGGAGNDQMFGGAGNDRMLGNAGYDLLQGGDGNDSMLGGDGNDTMLGEAGMDQISGENGDDNLSGGDSLDILLGGNGNDVIHGDAGNDIIAGGAGNDDLFGGADNDQLEGGPGNDGLFGGSGQEHLYGNGGIDRFLRWDAPGNKTTVHDKASSESLTYFKDQTQETDLVRDGLTLRYAPGQWSEGEIELVDTGLEFLHHEVGNTKMLKRANGGDMTFLRIGAYIPYDAGDGIDDANDQIANRKGLSLLGTNHGNGAIDLNQNDFTFASPDEFTASVVHELAHNWQEANGRLDEWLALSGWVKSTTPNANQILSNDGQWVYDKNAEFARDYGKTNPHEDFATMFEAYFWLKTGQLSQTDIVRLTPKLNFLGLFITRLGQ